MSTIPLMREVGIKRRFPIARLRTDFQRDECLIEDTVFKYRSDLICGRPIEPVEIRFDGAEYWLEDGFHRVAAHRQHGRKTIAANVTFRRASEAGTLADMQAEWDVGLQKLKAELSAEVQRQQTKS
jgi:hypothetical protein